MSFKNKIKVLLVIQTPPPYGGGEIQAQYLKEYFINKAGFLIYDYSRKWRLRKNQEKYNLLSFLFGIFWIVKISYLILRIKPEKLYFTLPKSFLGFLRNSAVIYIASFFNVKILAELPGQEFPFINDSNSFKDKFGKNILSKINQIRFLTETIKYNFEKLGVKNGIVIKNGVKIFPGKSINYNDKLLKILFIGSICEKKGFKVCLEAIKLLSHKNISFHFDVVGDFLSNKEKDYFFNYISENSLKQKISFFGIVNGREKWDIFAQNHILLFPSYWEGVPYSILEALGMGLTIIASKLDGIKDTIENEKNGYLIDLGDYNKIYQIIENLFYNRELLLYFKNNNIKKYNEEYKLEIFLENMKKWFNA